MKYFLLIGGTLLLACSSMKKVVIPMSKIQTDQWENKPEALVISKLGPYKKIGRAHV